MEDGKSTASDSDYCPKCKVKIMDDACFCEWEDIAQTYDQRKQEWFEENVLRAEEVQEMRNQEFRDKIKSIGFDRVKGGGRG